MTRRYTFSTFMEDRILGQILDKKLFMIPFSILSLYNGLIIVLTIFALDDYDIARLLNCDIDLEIFLGIFIGVSLASLIPAIMGDRCVKRDDPLGARKHYSLTALLAGVYLFFVLLVQGDGDSRFLLIITILMLLLVGASVAYALYTFQTNIATASVLIDNLSKDFLEIGSDGLTGITHFDITRPGDGQFFELKYEDIREVNASHFDPRGKAYYTFFIHHKYGTYRLAFTGAREAEMYIQQKLTRLREAQSGSNDL